ATLQSAPSRGRPQPAAQHSPTTAQARSLAGTPLHGTHPAPTAAECAAPRPAPAPRHAPVLFASPRQQRTPEPSFGPTILAQLHGQCAVPPCARSYQADTPTRVRRCARPVTGFPAGPGQSAAAGQYGVWRATASSGSTASRSPGVTATVHLDRRVCGLPSLSTTTAPASRAITVPAAVSHGRLPKVT